MIRIGVIGYGYWGPNLARNFSTNPRTELVAVSDFREDRLELVKNTYPGVKTTAETGDIFDDSSIDAVAIATPVSTHFQLAKQALEKGKHVLVEKPFTNNSEHARILVELAREKGLVVAVDHVFLFTGAVRKIRELYDKGELGRLRYFDSTRINLGLFQHDVNVIWDLAAHDVSIMDYLFPEAPLSVQASGTCHTGNEIENIAYVTVNFEDDMIGHFHVNWLSPVKVRMILIGGEKKMVVFDDTQTSEKLKVYDSGIEITPADKDKLYHTLIQYRTGDMYSPKLDQAEALKGVVDHFAECIQDKKHPLNDAESGLRVVKILEAADKSVKDGGSVVKL